MKKEYINPIVDVIELSLTGIIALSIVDGPITDGEAEEATDAFRGDWNDIWGDCK